MTFKAGTYYIGDPCYVLSEKDWDKILGNDGHSTIKGKDVFFAGTAYGDGTYEDQNKNEYPVDTGCIGIFPVEVCLKTKLKEVPKRKMGMIFTFDADFEVSANNGNFTFGDVEIITDGSNEEEEDCWCDCHYQ